MGLKEIGDFIAVVGFPGFVAIYILTRLRPSIDKLRDAITTLTVVTAKSNGISGKDVAEIVSLVTADRSRGRRIEDQVDGLVSGKKKK